jgi:hypothetical protein
LHRQAIMPRGATMSLISGQKIDQTYRGVIPTGAQRSGGICCLHRQAIMPRVATMSLISGQKIDQHTEASSRPKRSAVEGSAVCHCVSRRNGRRRILPPVACLSRKPLRMPSQSYPNAELGVRASIPINTSQPQKAPGGWPTGHTARESFSPCPIVLLQPSV